MSTRSLVSLLALAGSLLGTASSAWLALGCGTATPPIPRAAIATKSSDRGKAAKADGSGMQSGVLAEVPEGTVGPYIAYGPASALVLFAPPSQRQRHWWTRVVDAGGMPRGTAQKVAEAPNDPAFAVVRPLRSGFLALWSARTAQQPSVRALVLDAKGVAGGTVADLPAEGQVLWIQAFDGPQGPLVFWAEQHRERAALKVARLSQGGTMAAGPFSLTTSATAWQAAPTSKGAAIAFVIPAEGGSGADVALVTIGENGKPGQPPQVLSTSATAQPDVDVASAGDNLVIAWTDRQGPDSRVLAVVTGPQGNVLQGPDAPLMPTGDQALLALLALRGQQTGSVLVAYEELPATKRSRRTLRFATVDTKLSRAPRQASVEFAPVGRAVTELGAAPDGYVVLTSAQACANAAGCADPTELPWYVRLSSSHGVTGGAPLLVDTLGRNPPEMVWSPGCMGTTCMALAVGAGDPARVLTVTLPAGAVQRGVPARADAPPSPPWITSSRTLRVFDAPISAIATTQLGATTFLGSITHFVEGPGTTTAKPPARAPGNPQKPTAARLEVMRVDAQGQVEGQPTIVSVRALSAGGLALAPAPAGAQEVCVAWIARDFGNPQVFLTRVGADGKTKLQRMLTRARGDATDVAIAAYKTGYVVAWVDWRDGNGEVYAALVNQALLRTGPEVRLTRAAGDASDVALLVRGDEVFVAYGDPRDHAAHATASPYVQKLSLPSLARAGSEVRAYESLEHASNVKLVGAGEDIVLAWNEEALPGAGEARRAGVRLGRLDLRTLQLMEVSTIATRGGGAPAALGLTCGDGVCRGALTVRRGDVSTLDSFLWTAQGEHAATRVLARLNGATGVEVAPELVGDAVLYVDQGVDGEVRARRAAIGWTAP